jgi:hypothetical protein
MVLEVEFCSDSGWTYARKPFPPLTGVDLGGRCINIVKLVSYHLHRPLFPFPWGERKVAKRGKGIICH